MAAMLAQVKKLEATINKLGQNNSKKSSGKSKGSSTSSNQSSPSQGILKNDKKVSFDNKVDKKVPYVNSNGNTIHWCDKCKQNRVHSTAQHDAWE